MAIASTYRLEQERDSGNYAEKVSSAIKNKNSVVLFGILRNIVDNKAKLGVKDYNSLITALDSEDYKSLVKRDMHLGNISRGDAKKDHSAIRNYLWEQHSNIVNSYTQKSSIETILTSETPAVSENRTKRLNDYIAYSPEKITPAQYSNVMGLIEERTIPVEKEKVKRNLFQRIFSKANQDEGVEQPYSNRKIRMGKAREIGSRVTRALMFGLA